MQHQTTPRECKCGSTVGNQNDSQVVEQKTVEIAALNEKVRQLEQQVEEVDSRFMLQGPRVETVPNVQMSKFILLIIRSTFQLLEQVVQTGRQHAPVLDHPEIE